MVQKLFATAWLETLVNRSCIYFKNPNNVNILDIFYGTWINRFLYQICSLSRNIVRANLMELWKVQKKIAHDRNEKTIIVLVLNKKQL